jgi:diaminohydroxyphosphoribosylaminopyrimidine deaminase/5-amino-6-(5-phosphoribosylamino)uracil reductase
VINLALELARQAQNLSAPNPAVGCVLVSAGGEVIGQGHTQAVGGAHAEVMALRDAAARGHASAGATAYVTLEPCAHQGRTGPCCEALIAAGVARVVASLVDPNPRVAGQGLARLRAAGVQVEVGPGEQAARELNLGFFSRMVRASPWVRMKLAASLDGTSALTNGQSQWITSPQARSDGHAWRARACAAAAASEGGHLVVPLSVPRRAGARRPRQQPGPPSTCAAGCASCRGSDVQPRGSADPQPEAPCR